ncbi:MAG TPA: CHRD domain-containing protein [Burkholderiales bacterium]|nr:CHRD domain-containing protein [Burkholderiales bacterium]
MTRTSRSLKYMLGAAAFALIAGCASMGGDVALRMTGAEEVPPVKTGASGTGALRVADDRSVSGTFKTQGGPFTAAHIHEAPMGQNGPVIIPLRKVNDNEWAVPDNAKLTDAQYESFRNGRLYVNFHSAAHKGGEIRAQIQHTGGSSKGGASGGSSSSGY